MPPVTAYLSAGPAGVVPVTFAAVDPQVVGLAADNTARTLSGLAVPFGIPSAPSMDGERYRFTGPPANLGDLVDVVVEHNPDALIGRLSKPWTSDTVGLSGIARVFATARGNDALVEASEGARSGFSIGAEIQRYTTAADGVRDVAAGDWSAVHLGVVRRPAFAETLGVTVHASTPTRKEHPMDPEKPETPQAVELPTVAELAAKVAEVLKPQAAAVHPLAKFANFAQFSAAFGSATEPERVALAAAFAVGDQLLADNPGLQPPVWRSTIQGNINARRPAVSAFGTVPVPATGTEATWPYLDPAINLDQVVAEQVNETDALSGIKLSILKGTAGIKTAGTVSSIGYQLLMRSSPSYRAAYLELCMAAWARYVEAKFEAKLFAAGTNTAAAVDLTSADNFAAQLFAASFDVDQATGAPADIAAVDPATFKTLGALPGLRNPSYGTNNTPGVASARTLRIDVNGLVVTPWPFLPAGTLLVTNSTTAKAADSGAQVATADDVTKLSRDVAVWGMYEDGEVYIPAGVRVYEPQA